MKIQRLKEIIREEVKRALKEKNGTEVAPSKPGTKEKPTTMPDTDDDEFEIKDPQEEPAKAEKIADKIAKRYIALKNKTNGSI